MSKNATKPTESGPVVSTNPHIIDSLGMKGLYDSTKWALYSIYCDQICTLKHDNLPDDKLKIFGMLDLRFYEMRKFNDTVELDFYFYYNDSIRCDNLSLKADIVIATGAGFKNGNDSILYYTSPTSLHSFWKSDPRSRFYKPLQPEVLLYIRNHKKDINTWFLKEAERRGVFN